MKIRINLLILLVIIIANTYFAFAQSTTNNVFIGTPYLGWTTNNNLDFNFSASNQYMQLNSAIGTRGNLGLSNPASWTAGFIPRSLLHLDDNVTAPNPNDIFAQWTNGGTGNGAANGFKVGLRYDAPTGMSFAELRQQEIAPISFYTQDPTTNLVTERVRIVEDVVSPDVPN
jgi:hypothetical protein